MKVGFIGLGHMGAAMAANLIRAGHGVLVFNRIYGPRIAQGKFEPAAFAAPLAYKDVRLAPAAAESLKVPMPLGSLLARPL
jgi:3-hydroxyisobutyrate dehydrogenase-like beta-hydroxyacid dehydrogenase